MSTNELSVTWRDGDLVVKGAVTDGAWTARQLDERRLLLAAVDDATGIDRPTGLVSCPMEMLKDILISLSASGWSGVVAVDTSYGVKRVFFSRGLIVFAASSIMDDRLGEVIYREAMINLDELTNSAAQVTKTRKFGQVLISSGIFTNVQLWQALKLQVRQILRSLFMVERVYLELQAGDGLAPTEVVFDESVPELISDCYSFGAAFRAFLGKLRAESRVVILGQPAEKEEGGTFTHDLLELIQQQDNVQQLLNDSKLIDTYTVAALLCLVNQGFCKIMPEAEDTVKAPAFAAPLKAKFDAYMYVLQAVRKAFGEASKDFPGADLRAFAASLNPVGFPSLHVDGMGTFGRDSAQGILHQCLANPQRVAYFATRIESMIQFLLQVAGDNLPYQVASQIRRDYRSIAP